MSAYLAPKSGIHAKPGRMLPLVEDLKHIHPDLLRQVRLALLSARKQIEGILTDESGQGILDINFVEEVQVEEVQVPENDADAIIEEAQSKLYGTGIKLERTPDSVRAVRDDEREDPRKAIGYPD